MEQQFANTLQLAKAQSLCRKSELTADDITVLKSARQKLFTEQQGIIDEKKRIREENKISLFSFAKSEPGKQFEAQYGQRLKEIAKALDELNSSIQAFEKKERETKKRQSETLEEKQARKKELIEQRVSLSREESKISREIRDIRLAWSPVQERLLDELQEQGRSLKELHNTQEWKDHSAKLAAAELKMQQFKEENNITLDKINTEIELLSSEIDAYLNNEDYVKYHKELSASGLCVEDFRRKQIIEAYGTTTNPHLAGYIFPDGKMLKMGEEGYRGEDHRLVRAFYEPGSKEFNNAEASLWAFIAEGNIRWMPEGPGISIDANQPMTRDQKMALYDIVDYAKGKSDSFYMDVVNGNSIKSYKYDRKQMNVAKITKDFNEYRKELGLTQPATKKHEKESR